MTQTGWAAAMVGLLVGAPLPGTAQPVASDALGLGVPTFARDIAPIVLSHCAPCHHTGGSAPFPLTTYSEVRPRAKQVVAAVLSRDMPPWKPEPAHGPRFLGERRLSDAQIALFERWLSLGARAGSDGDVPPMPTWNDDWTLGPPDLVVKAESGYRLRAQGADELRQYVISAPISHDRYVKAWQFSTTAGDVIHHATFLLDSTGTSRRLDEADPAPGYDGLVALGARNPDGYFLGWTPGQAPYEVPQDMAWHIAPGDDFVALLHLMPNGEERDIEFSLGLYFSDTPPANLPVMIRLNRQDIDIPAGASMHSVVDSYTLPVDVELHTIQPHAHRLAREVRGSATRPDGSQQELLYIKNWDFHWQDIYRLAEPLLLPSGTAIRMEFIYDNSADNPRNPHRPPRRVTYGQRASDEMGDLWMQVVPRRPAERARLAQSVRAKLLPQHIAGYESLLRGDPDNPSLHDDLAILLVEAGDYRRAAEQFGESVRVKPYPPSAHYNLGNALLGLREFGQAEARFRQAIRLQPTYGLAVQGLGLACSARGRDDEAARHFAEAVRLLGTSDVHLQFAVFRERQGQIAEALEHYEAAARIAPNEPDTLMAVGRLRLASAKPREAIDAFRAAYRLRPHAWEVQAALAWVLATTADTSLRAPEEAVRLAENAAVRSQSARVLDVLAVALAATGAFDRAETIGLQALVAAQGDGNAELSGAIRSRVTGYRRRQPYVAAYE